MAKKGSVLIADNFKKKTEKEQIENYSLHRIITTDTYDNKEKFSSFA